MYSTLLLQCVIINTFCNCRRRRRRCRRVSVTIFGNPFGVGSQAQARRARRDKHNTPTQMKAETNDARDHYKSSHSLAPVSSDLQN